jgi:hypothetical protein
MKIKYKQNVKIKNTNNIDNVKIKYKNNIVLVVLSKKSRKKDSFHTISEASTTVITLSYILMDSVEDPFFKNPSIPCVGHTKHYTKGNTFWISTKATLHVPSIHTTKNLTSSINLMCSTMRSSMKSMVLSSPIVSMETRSLIRERTPMMMF